MNFQNESLLLMFNLSSTEDFRRSAENYLLWLKEIKIKQLDIEDSCLAPKAGNIILFLDSSGLYNDSRTYLGMSSVYNL